MTSASNVAHDLYEKLGYEDIHVPPKAFKRRSKTRSDVRFEREKDPGYVRSMYMNSVEKLTGLVIRENEFWKIAESRGWPNNKDVRIGYKNGKRIGYAMFNSSRDRLSVKEIGAEKDSLSDILQGLESRTQKEHIVLSHVNPAYKEEIENEGYRWTYDLWERVMIKDLSGKDVDAEQKFSSLEGFHMGPYEAY